MKKENIIDETLEDKTTKKTKKTEDPPIAKAAKSEFITREEFNTVIKRINQVNGFQDKEFRHVRKQIKVLSENIQRLNAETGGYITPMPAGGGKPFDGIDTEILGGD